MICELCGQATKSKYGVCDRPGRCHAEANRRSRLATYPNTNACCELCGKQFFRSDSNKYGVCKQTAECRTEYQRRRWADKHPNTNPCCEICGKQFLRASPHGVCNRPGECRKEYGFRSKLVANYRKSHTWYYEQLERQNGRCAVCPRTEASGNGRFHVDHDHACCPGRESCGDCVRGLLCHFCNAGLGHFCDDPAILRAALDYLATKGTVNYDHG